MRALFLEQVLVLVNFALILEQEQDVILMCLLSLWDLTVLLLALLRYEAKFEANLRYVLTYHKLTEVLLMLTLPVLQFY